MLPVVQYLKEVISTIHKTANPLRFGLRIQQLVLIVLVSAINGNNFKSTLMYE